MFTLITCAALFCAKMDASTAVTPNFERQRIAFPNKTRQGRFGRPRGYRPK